MAKEGSSSRIRLYSVGGIAFGFVFPTVVWTIEIVRDNALWSLNSIWQLHIANPAVWIVDIAPIVLGIFARQIGILKETQTSLKTSEAQLRLFFDNNPIPTWVFDQETLNFLAVNDAAVKSYGYSRDEFLSMKATDIRPAQDAPLFVGRIKEQSVSETDMLSVHQTKRGEKIDVKIAYRRIEYQGRPARLTVALNVTEEKRAQNALKESEARLRHIIDNADEIIYRADTDGRFVFANGAAARIMKYPMDELMGRYYLDLLHPDSRHREERFYRLQFLRKIPNTYREVKAVCKDGTAIWLGQTVQLLMEGDRVVGFQSIARDITERKRAEDTLREREQVLRRIVETAEDGIYIVDLSGKMTFANPAMERILGASHEAITSRDFDDPAWKITTLDGSPFPNEQQPFLRVMRTKKPVYNVEQVVTRSDGSHVIVSINAAPLLDNSGNVIGEVGALTDVTERKAVDRLKNEFVSTVSHELRTPLTSILGSLGLIMGGAAGEVSAPALAMIDIAYNNSERLVRLINDILDIEKIESGKMAFHFKPLELMPLIEHALDTNRGYGEKLGVAFEIESRVVGVKVNGDGDRLAQVLANLLSNAAKFTPRNETVRIAVTRRDHTVRIEVRDRGPGVSDEFRKRIFQKFAQADSSDTRQKGGTGLGLSISKVIVEKHGGQIGFESELNKGAMFFFELPEWRDETPALLAAVPSSREVSTSAHILICEDDPDIAHLLELMLRQAGYRTDVAYNAAQAKQFLARTAYAAMTLDIALPDQNGLALYRELRENEETRNLPIIFVSIKAEEGQAELNGDALLVLDWIEKPINQARLVEAVRRATTRKTNQAPRALHVEDDTDIQKVVVQILRDTATVITVDNLKEARALLEREAFDLVILDLALKDGSGIDLIPFLHSCCPTVPIIVFSASELDAELSNQVSAALVKSRVTNDDLLDTIKTLVSIGR